MPTVFLNGRFMSGEEARVSAFDAGLQHAVGLFETMSARVRDEAADVAFLDRHLDRLIGSAAELGLSSSLRRPALAEAVARTVEHAWAAKPFARARVRLTVTGGDLNLLGRRGSPGAAGPGGSGPAHDPTILIVAQPATVYPPELIERGARVSIAELRVNPLDPFGGHKTLNYWPRLRELQRAGSKRADEAIVFQVTNHLAGGCVSNMFLIKGGELLTPIARGEEQEVAEEGDRAAGAHGAAAAKGAVMPSPVLPGVTRRFVLDWAEENGVAVRRRMLGIDDLLAAEEVFLTNSSWGVLPVVRVEDEVIGAGSVGEVSRKVRGAWMEATEGG